MATAQYRLIPDYEELDKQGCLDLFKAVGFTRMLPGRGPNRSTVHLWQRNIGKDEAKIGRPSLD